MGTKRRPQPRYLGRKLLQIRMNFSLSQEGMAKSLTSKLAPVYPAHISEFERGIREPSLLVLLKYAQLADISTDVLIDDKLGLPSNES